MLEVDVLSGLHFDEPRGGAAKELGYVARGTDAIGLRVGRADEMYPVLVELVDEGDEPARLVTPHGAKTRNAVEHDGAIMLCYAR